jgi:hypothetical protein
MSTREESLAALESLGVANVFADSYRSKKLPHNLDIHFGPPEEFFLAPDTHDVYTNGRLIPLLDDGNFGIVTFLDPDTSNFVQVDVEEPEDSRTVLTSWQQYLADVFIGIAESGADDDELAVIAKLIGFQHMDRTLEFIDSAPDFGWCEARDEFIASL